MRKSIKQTNLDKCLEIRRNSLKITSKAKPLRYIDIDEEHQVKYQWPNGIKQIGG